MCLNIRIFETRYSCKTGNTCIRLYAKKTLPQTAKCGVSHKRGLCWQMAKQVDISPSLPVSLLFTPFVRSLFRESGHIVPEIPFANRVKE
jgi:hypothetical protein